MDVGRRIEQGTGCLSADACQDESDLTMLWPSRRQGKLVEARELRGGKKPVDDLGTWFSEPASSGLQLPTPLVLVNQMPLLDSSETCIHTTHARMRTQIKTNKQTNKN